MNPCDSWLQALGKKKLSLGPPELLMLRLIVAVDWITLNLRRRNSGLRA